MSSGSSSSSDSRGYAKLSHEKLDVYNRSLDFIEFTENILQKINLNSFLYD